MSPQQMYLTARALDDSIKKFYESPENEAKFHEWLKDRKETIVTKNYSAGNGADSGGDGAP